MADHAVVRARARVRRAHAQVLTLRIVGGRLGGRHIAGPRGNGTRPTAERVREAIASALDARGWIEGAIVLDLFAGTGALAFEAVSRGAVRAICVDKDPALIRAIKDGAKALDAPEVEAIALDLGRAGWLDRLPRNLQFSLVFADPPYERIELVAEILSALRAAKKLSPGAAIVIEHGRRAPPMLPAGFGEVASYRYGDTAVSLSTAPEEP